MADDNDDNDVSAEDDDKVDIRNWKLTEIQRVVKNYKDREGIRQLLKAPYYKDLELPEDLTDDFLIRRLSDFLY